MVQCYTAPKSVLPSVAAGLPVEDQDLANGAATIPADRSASVRFGDTIVEATAALDRGWTLIALQGKQPYFPPHSGRNRWHKVTTVEMVHHYVQLHCNFGVLCKPSEIVVIDIDPRNGASLLDKDRYPQTLTAETGSGGLHLIFRAPKVNLVGKDRDGINGHRTGIDVISSGFIVLAPGFDIMRSFGCVEMQFTVATRSYRWINDLPVSELDDDNVARLTKPTKTIAESRPSPRLPAGHLNVDMQPGTVSCPLPLPHPLDEFDRVQPQATPSTNKSMSIIHQRLGNLVYNAPVDDSERDICLASEMKRWGLDYEFFSTYIGSLPRRKTWKATNAAYLHRTWDMAIAPRPLKPPSPPSPSLLLPLTTSVFLDTGNKSERSSSERVRESVDQRVVKSRRLVAGFLLWKHDRLGFTLFKVARSEIARVTGLTEKTVGLRLHDLEEMGLIKLTKTWKTQRANFTGEPRYVEITTLIRRAERCS